MCETHAYFLHLSDDTKYFVELSAPSVHAWFRPLLQAAADGEPWFEMSQWLALGDAPYGLGVLFDRVFDEGCHIPSQVAKLQELLRQKIYAEKDLVVEPHFVHVETDDDEGTDIEYYFFDDHFLSESDAHLRLPDPDVTDASNSGEFSLLDEFPDESDLPTSHDWEKYRELWIVELGHQQE